MAEATINSGACGFLTKVRAESTPGYEGTVELESTCPHVAKINGRLGSLKVMNELFKRGESQILEIAKELPHITCPVPVGILKALEVSAGMAVPKDVTIEVKK